MLNKKNVLGMRRRLKKMQQAYVNGETTLHDVQQRIYSWIGHAMHADTFRLRSRLLEGVVFQRGGADGASWRLVDQQPAKCAVRGPLQGPPV